jgi:hypothetical protein
MTITITQMCNKCKRTRTLRQVPAAASQKTFSPLEGGWRQFGDKNVCPDCLNEFVNGLS